MRPDEFDFCCAVNRESKRNYFQGWTEWAAELLLQEQGMMRGELFSDISSAAMLKQHMQGPLLQLRENSSCRDSRSGWKCSGTIRNTRRLLPSWETGNAIFYIGFTSWDANTHFLHSTSVSCWPYITYHKLITKEKEQGAHWAEVVVGFQALNPRMLITAGPAVSVWMGECNL